LAEGNVERSCGHSIEDGVTWRRRPAGDFSGLNSAQKRRRDAGATKTFIPHESSEQQFIGGIL
jgi:hypothetical protein